MSACCKNSRIYFVFCMRDEVNSKSADVCIGSEELAKKWDVEEAIRATSPVAGDLHCLSQVIMITWPSIVSQVPASQRLHIDDFADSVEVDSRMCRMVHAGIPSTESECKQRKKWRVQIVLGKPPKICQQKPNLKAIFQ